MNRRCFASCTQPLLGVSARPISQPATRINAPAEPGMDRCANWHAEGMKGPYNKYGYRRAEGPAQDHPAPTAVVVTALG